MKIKLYLKKVKIFFSNGGWLDESHFLAPVISNGTELILELNHHRDIKLLISSKEYNKDIH